MRIERVSNNKIKIFLTLDDLVDRGITKEDILGNSLKVQKLFQEMVEEACENFYFKMNGSIAIEIFTLPAQGLIIIITKEEGVSLEDEEDLNLRVRYDDCPHMLYAFDKLEDIIQLSHQLNNHSKIHSTLYFYEGIYYLLLDNVEEMVYDKVISIAEEFGYASTLTIFRMNEYGKCIIEKEAIHMLSTHFRK